MDNAEFRQIAYEVARHHHEKYNGGGYPDGLMGEQIPLHARIMAIADHVSGDITVMMTMINNATSCSTLQDAYTEYAKLLANSYPEYKNTISVK